MRDNLMASWNRSAQEIDGAKKVVKQKRTLPWLTSRSPELEERAQDDNDESDGEESLLESDTEVDDDDFLLMADEIAKQQFKIIKARTRLPDASRAPASPASPASTGLDRTSSIEPLTLTPEMEKVAAQRQISVAVRRKGSNVKGEVSKMQRLCGYGEESRRAEYELLRVSTPTL